MPLDPEDVRLELTGHAEDGWIIWHDGSEPTPIPGEQQGPKPAALVCQSEADDE